MKLSVFNKIGLVIIITMLPDWAMAANKAPASPIWAWTMNNIVLILGVLIVIGAISSLLNLMDSIMISKERALRKANGLDPIPVAVATGETFLYSWYKKLSGLKPMEKEADIQLDHDYDGIKELDNSLPPWWVYSFYASIIVACAYLYVHHFSDIGLNQEEEYALEMEIGEKRKAEYAARQANNIDEANLVALMDERSLQTGMTLFKTNCAACHGQAGEGGVGPNLTDEYWLHGGSMPDVYRTIKYGVPEKGMIAWKAQMQPAMIHKIASYIETLQGSNPPNSKEKQGVLYKAELTDQLSMNTK